MDDIKTKVGEREPSSMEPSELDSSIRQQVQEIKEAVHGVVSETSLTDKVDELRSNIDNISEDVQSQRGWQKNTYLEALETLKSQVDEIQNEWATVWASMETQRERLESLLQSFPGVIETSTLKALSLRVTHLEELVSKLFQESHAKATAVGTRRQLIISLVALGVTVALWGLFIGLNILK